MQQDTRDREILISEVQMKYTTLMKFPDISLQHSFNIKGMRHKISTETSIPNKFF